MSEKAEASVIGSLPHARPQRRSDKRAARPTAEPPLAAAGRPSGHPRTPEPDQPSRCPSAFPEGAELVGTAIRATAELAEIGLTLGARTIHAALSRLPRP